MESLRSQETLQREYDLQAEHTARMNNNLQSGGLPGYRETLQDYAIFANTLRKFAPEKSLVILHERPEIILHGEGEGYEVDLYINGNMWRFKVNKSVHYELPPELSAGAGLKLKRLWDVVIPNLPENFIVRGRIDQNDPKEETKARTKIQQSLGFSLPQIDDCVYGIVKEGKMIPITLEEVKSLIGGSPDTLNQTFDVKRINWPGA
jgi:hypothetical protein